MCSRKMSAKASDGRSVNLERTHATKTRKRAEQQGRVPPDGAGAMVLLGSADSCVAVAGSVLAASGQAGAPLTLWSILRPVGPLHSQKS